MSIKVNIKDLTNDSIKKIQDELIIKIENKFGFGEPKYIYPYTMENNIVQLPFTYAVQNLQIKRPLRTIFPQINLKFEGKLLDEQKIIYKEALNNLSKNGSIMISCYPGFGKTCLAINLSINIGFKTLIIVNKIVLIKQWQESILKFCKTATIQILSPKSKKEDVDFYIINAQNVEKIYKNFFLDIGNVIVDEAHMIMAETLSRSLKYIYPRYLIGLTATPYRPDGLDTLLDFYFGTYKIIRKLHREHIVYKISTNFKPQIEKTIQGKINWNSILDFQANNEERNNLIIKIIQKFKDRNFLVLVKRVEQGKYLINELEKIGESVTNLIGNNQEFDKDARVLVGTCQKVGVGFDHSKLDSLILATDLEEYFIQYLGRIFRTKIGIPIVFDFVDNNNILKKHYKTRLETYKNHGGIIKDFDINTLN